MTEEELKAALASVEWISFRPGGQLMPAAMIRATHQERVAMGFRWDGNKAVFPAWWPPSAEALAKFLEG